jgi:HAE1 family hydrophobic/amphiphilic exporter-1
LVKTIAKEGRRIKRWIKLEIAKDSNVFTLEAADAVVHDLLIAVLLVAFVMLFSCTVFETHWL